MKKRLAPPAALASLAAASAAALLGALAVSAAAQPPPAPPPKPAGSACFWVRNVTNFAANDTNTLYLRVGGNQVWRLSLFANYFQINWVHRVGLRSRGASSNVCEGRNPGLDVVVRDVAIGRQSCPVTDVRKLTPDEFAALPKNARP
jgi:hypothetical protein